MSREKDTIPLLNYLKLQGYNKKLHYVWLPSQHQLPNGQIKTMNKKGEGDLTLFTSMDLSSHLKMQ